MLPVVAGGWLVVCETNGFVAGANGVLLALGAGVELQLLGFVTTGVAAGAGVAAAIFAAVRPLPPTPTIIFQPHNLYLEALFVVRALLPHDGEQQIQKSYRCDENRQKMREHRVIDDDPVYDRELIIHRHRHRSGHIIAELINPEDNARF